MNGFAKEQRSQTKPDRSWYKGVVVGIKTKQLCIHFIKTLSTMPYTYTHPSTTNQFMYIHTQNLITTQWSRNQFWIGGAMCIGRGGPKQHYIIITISMIVPFHVGCLFCIGAYKHDVVVVIKNGCLFLWGAYFVWVLIIPILW